MSTPSTLSTFCFLYRLLSLPSNVSTFYCLHLLLFLPSAVSTFYFLYLLMSPPSTLSTFYFLYQKKRSCAVEIARKVQSLTKKSQAQPRLHEKFTHRPKEKVMRSQDCTKSSFIDKKKSCAVKIARKVQSLTKKSHAQSRLHEKFSH